MLSAQVLKNSIRIFQRAGLIGTDSDDTPANRLVVEEGIELDNAVNIDKRHAQRPRDFGRDRLRDPAIHFLSRVQGWQ
jgi:hypothetical protein